MNPQLINFLISQGYNGQVNEMLYSFLGDEGYTGSLNDRLSKYLVANNYRSLQDWIRSLSEPSAPTALSTAPATLERAMLAGEGHFVFNGSDELTGFSTTDLMDVANDSTVTGAPVKGPNGGFMITEATADANYVTTTIPQIFVNYPGTRTLLVCFKRNGVSDDAGMLVGVTATSFLGAFENGVTTSEVLYANSRCENFISKESIVSAGATRNDLHDLVYPGTAVTSVAMSKVRAVGGICRWGRYNSAATTYHMEAEILGWAVINSVITADINEANEWLETWAPNQ